MEPMSKQRTNDRNTTVRTSRELLVFQDDFNALNARIAFVLTAVTRIAETTDPLDPRSAAGATDCAIRLNAETRELEQRIRRLRELATPKRRAR
jgi:hypothetical protein